jgi:flagellin-like protein
VRRLRSKRGLSPLIATVVLISATIVGGMLVYNYFQKSFNSVTARSGALQVSATSEYLSDTSKLVHITLLNTYDQPVKIKSIVAVYQNGSVEEVSIISSSGTSRSASGLSVTIPSGGKYSVVAVVPNDAVAVYVTYTIGNSNTVLQSSPVKIY